MGNKIRECVTRLHFLIDTHSIEFCMYTYGLGCATVILLPVVQHSGMDRGTGLFAPLSLAHSYVQTNRLLTSSGKRSKIRPRSRGFRVSYTYERNNNNSVCNCVCVCVCVSWLHVTCYYAVPIHNYYRVLPTEVRNGRHHQPQLSHFLTATQT